MRRLIVNGLFTIFPLAVTIVFATWLLSAVEGLFAPLVITLFPESWYFPGLGILVGSILLLGIAILLNAWFVKVLHSYFERVLDRVPLVRDLYRWVQNLANLFRDEEGQEKGQPVILKLNGTQMIGILTCSHAERVSSRFEHSDGEELVAVYLPMSYQMGGYTVYIPKNNVQPLDWSFQEAMEVAMTASVSKQ